jgi:Hypothetical glycosyl hydrolase family 15
MGRGGRRGERSRRRFGSTALLLGLTVLCLAVSQAWSTPSASAATETFGKTSVGVSVGQFTADRKRVNKYTLPTAGTVSELSVYLATTANSGQQVLKGIIYADAGGAPGKLLGTSTQLTFTSTSAAGWYHLTFPAPLQLAAGEYWIGEITGGSSGVAGYRYDGVAGARDWNSNTYTSGPTDPFGSFTNDNEQISLYATYTPAASPSPIGLKIAAAISSLTPSWGVSTTEGLEGFRVRWRALGLPWSAPIELPAGARRYTITGLSVQPYEVNVRAVLIGGLNGGSVTGVGTPLAQEETKEEEPPPGNGNGTGQVRFVKDANSSFDAQDIKANSAWINEHFYRMTGYSPWFDGNLSWYHRARVYDDAYAIYKGSSLASEHPEWIVRDASGNKLYIPFRCSGGSCPQYAADISNPAWRSHYISTLKTTLAKGYIGVFVDDVDMWANTSNASGQLVAPIDHNTGKPMTDEIWRGYFVTFMEELRAATAGYEITQNQLWYVAGGPAGNARIAQSMRQANCINIEFGVDDNSLTGGTGSLSVNSLLNYVDAVHSLGTAIDMGGDGTSLQERQYTLAGYFLVNSGNDLVSGNDSQTVTKFWPGWSVNLGEAKGPRSRTPAGLFERKFTHGLVYLNEPGATNKTITLPSAMKNLAGKTVTSIKLSASSGAVLHN